MTIRCALAALVVSGAVGACGSDRATGLSSAKGTVAGAITLVGGPPPIPGHPRPPLAGLVSVFTRAGKLVASQHVREYHHFRFHLAPGQYELNAGRKLRPKLDCPPNSVTVRAGQIARVNADVGCLVP
jgi:hypothetical protein